MIRSVELRDASEITRPSEVLDYPAEAHQFSEKLGFSSTKAQKVFRKHLDRR